MSKLKKESISLFWPYVHKSAIKAVSKTLKTRWIGQAHQVDEFEEKFTKYLKGAARGIAVNSGTSALHLAYILAGIKEGDEVLTPVLTCTATNIPLLYLKAKPVFCDIDPLTLNISVDDIKAKINEKTKAIVVVHFGGIPAEIHEILAIALRYNIPVIEDCAQAIGAEVEGQKVGAYSDFAAFSFQAIKNLTTGDGGMLMLRDEELIKKAKRLRWFGIDRELKIKKDWQPVWGRQVTYDVYEVGYKYQMTDITASIGLANLKHLNEVLKRRNEIASFYNYLLPRVKGISMLHVPYGKKSSNWLYQILVEDRDNFQKTMKERGIETNISHVRNDIYQIFGGQRLDLPVMNRIEDKYICLPIHPKMKLKDAYKVVKAIEKGW